MYKCKESISTKLIKYLKQQPSSCVTKCLPLFAVAATKSKTFPEEMISHAVLDHCREESTEAGRSGSLPRWLTGRATYNFINCPLGRILYTSGSFEIRYVVVTQDIRLLCFVGKTIRIGLGQNLFHLMASL